MAVSEIVAVKAVEAKEITTKSVEVAKKGGGYVIEKLNQIKNMSFAQLKEYMENNINNTILESTSENKESTDVKENLTDEQKEKVKEETGWSNEIIDFINSWEEYEIYKNAGLIEVEIGSKKCLIRNDIDWNQVDEKGKTNSERIKQGLSPLDKEGKKIQLHHIGQQADSPLAELTFKEHRCDGNDTILHDKKKETEIHGEGNNWDTERENYWKARACYNEEGSKA